MQTIKFWTNLRVDIIPYVLLGVHGILAGKSIECQCLCFGREFVICSCTCSAVVHTCIHVKILILQVPKHIRPSLKTLKDEALVLLEVDFLNCREGILMIFTFGLAPQCPIPEAAVETARKHWVRGLHWLVCCRYSITFALQKCQLKEWHFLLEWWEKWQETEFTQLSNEYAKTFWVILKCGSEIPHLACAVVRK